MLSRSNEVFFRGRIPHLTCDSFGNFGHYPDTYMGTILRVQILHLDLNSFRNFGHFLNQMRGLSLEFGSRIWIPLASGILSVIQIHMWGFL